MANFVLEDTSGHCEGVCFKYDDFAQHLEEDVIVQVKGKYEVSDRGNQLMAFEISRLELHEEEPVDDSPRNVSISIMQRDMTQDSMVFLNQILKKYPGQDGVALMVSQTDGRKFRAELPLTIDSRNRGVYTELHQLFGRQVWEVL